MSPKSPRRSGIPGDRPWAGGVAQFEFRTLGSIDLLARHGFRVDDILEHPKRLSLLAYLCVPCPRMHRRDVLVALLWPERDEAHARSALRQELYQIRRALGPGVVDGDRAAAVGVNRMLLWCDAQEFEAALDDGRPADALGLWGGEFLPGLHVAGGEFERWLDRMREYLQNRAVEAVRQLADAAERAGDEPQAICWARRLTELAPYDETGWRKLLLLLDRQGDRSGALKAFDDMAARLHMEMEVEPSPETLAMVQRIRARGNAFAPPAEMAPERPPHLRQSPNTRGRAVIGILPVENRTGDATLDVLAWRVTDRLAQGLADAMFVDVASIGETTQATSLVSAALYRRDDGVEVVPRLAEPGESGRLVEMPRAVGLSTEPQDVQLDTLVAHVLASVAMHYDPRFDAAAIPERGLPIRTPTWEAYLEYLQGSELFGRYQLSEGYRHLLRAFEIDPDFVKAGIFAAIALAESGEPAQAASLAASVMARNRPLSEYERTFGELVLADLHGRRAEAYRVAQEAAAGSAHPVLLHMAAREAFWINRPHEAIMKEEAILAGGTDRGWWRNRTDPWEVGCDAAHVLGHHRRELAAALDMRQRHPGYPQPIRAEVRARAALGESDLVLSLVGEAMGLPPGPIGPADIAWAAAQELTAHGQEAEAACARRTTLEWLMRRTALSLPERQVAVRLLLECGDTEAAATWLAPLAPFEDLESLGLAGLTAARNGDGELARHVLATLDGLTNPCLSGRHHLLAAEIQVALELPDEAVSTLRRAVAAGLPFDVELHARSGLSALLPRTDFRALLRPRD